MCGISGIVSYKKNIEEKTIDNMVNLLNHRGPDNKGKWIGENGSVCLGHNRLSILDLTENGNQPFHSKNNRYHLTFNGEIYNFNHLKKFLISNGVKNFSSNSDTEVLTELISLLGVFEATKLLNGMFAIGVWDSKEKKVHLIRDRFGEKPLFYSINNKVLTFASEINVIFKLRSIPSEINHKALSHYLKFNYINHPETIYKDIFKLSPGKILTFDQNMVPNIIKYDYNKSKKIIFNDKKEAEEILKQQIIKSCSSRTISDVSIGCFLSGGIDSSLIASIIQDQSKKRIKTFTIGFEEKSIDESKNAEKIANYLGTDHQTIMISNNDLIQNIPLLTKIYGEPFADQSSLATNILCKYASESLKVILSGDGGDEMFLGYKRYYQVNNIIKFLKITKKFKQENNMNYLLKNLLKAFTSFDNFSIKKDKAIKLVSLLIESNEKDIYQKFNSIYRDNIFPQLPIKKQKNFRYLDLKDINEMNDLDFNSYLPECILTKVDRASMFNSLEVRSPFLDHEIYSLINSFDLSIKQKILNKKYILKKILASYIPKKLFERPKQGFSAPLKNWLDGPLREWTHDLLSESNLKKHNLFDQKIISKLMYEHYSGIRTWHNQLWNLALFQQWYQDKKFN